MGHIAIQNPSVSADQVFDVFQRGLSQRYDVRRSALPAVDFIVRKSALVGVGVKLKSKKGEAKLRCAPMVPSTMLRMVLLNGLLPALLMSPVLKRTLKDVEEFASAAPELHGTQPAAAASSRPAPAAARGEVTSRPFLPAIWLGLTALVIPTIVNATFGWRSLVMGQQVILQAFAVAAIAFGLSRFVPKARLARPVALGLVSWYAASLACSLFGFGLEGEIRTWFTRYGLIEIAVLVASAFVLGRFTRGTAPQASPAPAAS
ncbi:MAG: hypothetical protein AAF726_16135 [Planctomycetota bacterium]